MIKVSDITRTYALWEALSEANDEYAYIDYPECTRYIIWTGLAHLGYYRIYKTDRNNIAESYGNVLVGHQDSVRTLIIRANSRKVVLDSPLDLSSKVL